MRQVLVRPSFHDWCENRLFEAGTSYNGVYRDAFALWKERATDDGYEINTWDTRPLESADVLWLLDLPDTRREFDKILSRLSPNCRLVLQILETPVLGLHAFQHANQAHFHAVLHYGCGSNPVPNHFHYRLPNSWFASPPDIPFAQRRGLLLLNSNRVEGWWAMRRCGLGGLPAIGKLLNGWQSPPGLLREYLTQERYSYRRQLARAAEREALDFVDLYGRGWNGEQVSWAPFYVNRPYRCWRGVASQAKHELCAQYRFVAAVENYEGNRGYISEKIFDALLAGAVPVYLGEERISEVIPEQSFVDIRRYRTPRALLQALRTMSEAEWKQKQQAGQTFLSSAAAQQFGNEQFALAALRTLQYVLHSPQTVEPAFALNNSP